MQHDFEKCFSKLTLNRPREDEMISMGQYIQQMKYGAITPTELGARIRRVREWRGWDVRRVFADSIGMNSGTLAGYERGSSTPSYFALIQIAEGCKVTVGQLLAIEVIPGFDVAEDALRDAGRNRVIACYEVGPKNATALDAVSACLLSPDDKGKALEAIGAIIDVTGARGDKA